MPSQDDPSNYTLPQKPFHPCLLKAATTLNTFNNASNPVKLSVCDNTIDIIGTSGENIHDMLKCTSNQTALDCMEMCLLNRNIAPTAPDTLPCHPFKDNDPFIIHQSPHIFFAGNQESFESKLITGKQGQKVRLIAIPKYKATNTVVLLDLKTMDVTPITFNTAIQ